MNGLQILQSLSAADRDALMQILGQKQIEQAEQNEFPAVSDHVWSKKIRQERGTKTFYAADGKPIANNPRQFPGYQPTYFPRALYKLSTHTFATVLIDPKTGVENPVQRTARSKQAIDTLKANGWKPVVEATIVHDDAQLAKHLKAGWIDSPATLNPTDDELVLLESN